MCEPGPLMKLCTCGPDEDLDFPRWELWRATREHEYPEVHAVGSIVEPSIDQHLFLRSLLLELKRPDVFDADLALRDGDNLNLYFGPEHEMSFEFEDGAWRERTMGSRLVELHEEQPHVGGAIRRA